MSFFAPTRQTRRFPAEIPVHTAGLGKAPNLTFTTSLYHDRVKRMGPERVAVGMANLYARYRDSGDVQKGKQSACSCTHPATAACMNSLLPCDPV